MDTCYHPTDKELRLSAMDMAIRIGTYETPISEVVARAKQIYAFLNKEPEQNG